MLMSKTRLRLLHPIQRNIPMMLANFEMKADKPSIVSLWDANGTLHRSICIGCGFHRFAVASPRQQRRASVTLGCQRR